MDKWIMNQISKYREGERQAALGSREGYGLPERALQSWKPHFGQTASIKSFNLSKPLYPPLLENK